MKKCLTIGSIEINLEFLVYLTLFFAFGLISISLEVPGQTALQTRRAFMKIMSLSFQLMLLMAISYELLNHLINKKTRILIRIKLISFSATLVFTFFMYLLFWPERFIPIYDLVF
jgi:hypothetical protein